MGGGVDAAHVPAKEVTQGEKKTLVNEKENGMVKQGPVIDDPIKFGSHGNDVPVKEEEEEAPTNLPKDAVDEWPEPKQIHSFYFPRVRPLDDPKLKLKIEQAEKELRRKNDARFQILEAIKAKRTERTDVFSQLKPLIGENKKYRTIVDAKRTEMKPLHEALGQLRTANNTNRERGAGLCSSEQELNDLIRSLNYKIQHESNTLVEEKQLLRDIKQLEGSRDKVIANAAMKAKIQDSLGQKDSIQDQVKLIGGDLDGVRKERQVITGKIKILDEELKAIDEDTSKLQEELDALSQSRDKQFEHIRELRNQREGGNSTFYQNRSLLNMARGFAANKDIAALEDLCNTEVEKFMSQWSSSKAFRDDYEKRILGSLDSRQLSRDGRMRNPNEKPLVSEPAVPVEREVVKPTLKRTKEEIKAHPQQDKTLVTKVQKEEPKKPTASVIGAKIEDPEEDFYVGKLQKEPMQAIDQAKLKEMKREEEIAKAKSALERKKKLGEKAAAKAAIRAQKEAEKKLKDREKKSKKKAGVTPDSEEQTKAENSESNEPENADVTVEAPIQIKNKEQKENTLRSRNRTRGGQESLPKVIVKRKKATPYWTWAAPAVLVILILLVLGYYYVL